MNKLFVQFLIFLCSTTLVQSQNRATNYQTSTLRFELWNQPLDQALTTGVYQGDYNREVRTTAQAVNNRVKLFRGIPTVQGTTVSKLLENGHIFEGEEISSCPPNTNIDLGRSFGMHMWVYIGYIDVPNNKIQTLFCRQEPTAIGPGIKLCLKFDSNNFFWIIKDSSTTVPTVAQWLGDDGFETIVMNDMKPELGWQYLAFNVYLSVNVTQFQGWYATDKPSSYNATKTNYKSVYQFLDQPLLNWLTVGAQMATTTTITEPFQGIIHEIEFFTKPLGIFQIHDQYTQKCQPYCTLCKVADIPKCIQQYEGSLLHYWDFEPPKFTYRQAIPDLRQRSALTNLSPDLYGTEPVAIVGGTEPVYVDRQGFYFETMNKQLAGTTNLANPTYKSLSIEAWIKFKQRMPNANICRVGPGNPGFQMRFQTALAEVVVNNIPFQMAVTINTDVWYFVVVSALKINNFQSRVCVLFFNTFQCNIINQIYVSGNHAIQVGGNFMGIINKIKVFQYPKTVEWESRHNMRLYSGGGCLDFNFRPCSQCDIEDKGPDTNFKYLCKSDCATNQYYTDCRNCHADCRTCYDYSEYNCHSCFDTDMDHHLLGTRCVQQCGLGKNLKYTPPYSTTSFYYYECDDANNISGDGCSRDCKPEKGYTCTRVGTGRSNCFETCGDGRRVLEQCDDHNTISGDGCSSSCTLEAGYVCLGGGLTNRDVCFERCGDGRDLFEYECDDGNTVSGDGCSQACRVEIGFTCVGGTPTTADKCSEICGDGLARGALACDDGNNDNGDGCDSNCAIEFGWACYASSNIVASVCYEISWPNIVDYWLENENNELHIKFNETLKIGSTWNESDWEIQITGPLPPYNFTWSLNKLNSLKIQPEQEIILNLTFYDQIFGYETLHFNFFDRRYTLSGTYNTATKSNGFSIDLVPQADALAGSCGIEGLMIPIYGMLFASLVLGIGSAAMMQTTAVMFHSVSSVQILSLAVMYEAAYPTCLVNFFTGLSVVGINFQMFGGAWLAGLTDTSNTTSFPYTELDYKFTRVGRNSSSFLYNSGDLVFFWVGIGIFYCIAFTIEFVWFAIPYLRTIAQRLRHNLFIVAMNFVLIKMAFDTTFSLFYIQFGTAGQIVSSSLCVLSGGVCLFFFGYLAYQGGQYTKELNEADPPGKVDSIRQNHLFSEYDHTHPTCYHYMIAQQVKKGIFVALAVSLYSSQCYALLLSAITSLFFLLYFSYVRPFRSPIYNVAIILIDLLTLACFVSLFEFSNIYNLNSLLNLKTKVKVFAILVMLLIIIPAVLIILDIIRMTKYYSQICIWKKDIMENKGDFDSSEEEKKVNLSDDLRNLEEQDSLVVKSITISSGDEDHYRNKLAENSSIESEPSLSPREERQQPRSPREEVQEDESEDEPVKKEPSGKTPPPRNNAPPPRASPKPPAASTQPPKQPTPSGPMLATSEAFDALDFSKVPEEAAATKDRLPDLKK